MENRLPHPCSDRCTSFGFQKSPSEAFWWHLESGIKQATSATSSCVTLAVGLCISNIASQASYGLLLRLHTQEPNHKHATHLCLQVLQDLPWLKKWTCKAHQVLAPDNLKLWKYLSNRGVHLHSLRLWAWLKGNDWSKAEYVELYACRQCKIIWCNSLDKQSP